MITHFSIRLKWLDGTEQNIEDIPLEDYSKVLKLSMVEDSLSCELFAKYVEDGEELWRLNYSYKRGVLVYDKGKERTLESVLTEHKNAQHWNETFLKTKRNTVNKLLQTHPSRQDQTVSQLIDDILNGVDISEPVEQVTGLV